LFTSPEQQSTEITLTQSKSIPFQPLLNSKGKEKIYVATPTTKNPTANKFPMILKRGKERKGTSH